MSRSRDYLWQIAQTLRHYDLVPEVSEEMIELACKKLRKESWISTTGGVFIVLQVFLPDRCILFDAEIDTCEEGAQVIRDCAIATMGEWVPAYVSTTVLSSGADGRRESIDFECQGTPFHWEFETTSGDGKRTDWPPLFYELWEQFLETHLQGFFFGPFLGNQTTFGCYLPCTVTCDLVVIKEKMMVDFRGDGFAAFVRAL